MCFNFPGHRSSRFISYAPRLVAILACTLAAGNWQPELHAGTRFISEFGYLGTEVDTPAITNEFGYYSAFGGPRDDRRDTNDDVQKNIGNTIINPHFVRRVGGPNGRALQMAAGGEAHALPGVKSELALWAEGNSYVRLSNFTRRAGGLGHDVQVDLSTNARGLLHAIADGNPEEVDAANAKFVYWVKNHTTGDLILKKEMAIFAGEGEGPRRGFNETDSFTIELPEEKRYDIETYGYVYSSGTSLANEPPIPPDDAAKVIDPFHARARQPQPDPAMELPQPLPVFGSAEGYGGSRLDYVGAVRGDDDAAIAGLPTFYIDETIIQPNEPLDLWFSVETFDDSFATFAVDNLLSPAPGVHAKLLQMQIGAGVGDDFSLTDNPELLGLADLEAPLDLRPELFFELADSADDDPHAVTHLLNVADEIDGVLDGFATFTLRHIVTGTAGDYDDDGLTDLQDYWYHRSTYGSTEDLGADGNADGRVDAVDYALWREWWDPVAVDLRNNNDSGFRNTAAIPEPATLLLATLGALVVAIGRVKLHADAAQELRQPLRATASHLVRARRSKD